MCCFAWKMGQWFKIGETKEKMRWEKMKNSLLIRSSEYNLI